MTIDTIRQDFPLLQKKANDRLVYFDSAATALKPLQVINAMNEYYFEYPANPGRGEYDLVHRAATAVEASRSKVAKFLHAKPEEIVFTSGTTMGINLVADAFVRKHLQRGDEIIIAESEHAANVLPWYSLQERYGIVVKIVSLDMNQRLTVDILKDHVSLKTKFLAFSDISNVLGTKTDSKSIISFAHQHGLFVLIDAAQSVPHFPIDVVELDVDFLVFSGHKMCGPTGIGVLYAKYDLLEKMDPYLMGGGMSLKYAKDFSIRFAPIPHRFEAGTQPVAEIIGLGAAIDYLMSIGFNFIHQQERVLRNRAIKGLQAIPFVKIYNPNAEAGIITFNLEGVFSQDAATHYNAHHIAIRSGQHCVRNLIDYLQTDGTLRWSCYFYNTEVEVDAFIEATKKGMDFLDAFFR